MADSPREPADLHGGHKSRDGDDVLEHNQADMGELSDADRDSISTGHNSGRTRDDVSNDGKDNHRQYSHREHHHRKSSRRDREDDEHENDHHNKDGRLGSNASADQKSTKEMTSVSSDKANIIYATNISPMATLEQMQTFFAFLGDIVNIALYHFDNSPEANFKVCFVEFSQHSSVIMAQHLTNTVFIDRAIFVLPYNKSKIPPDKETAEELGFGSTEYVTNFNPEVATQVTTGPGGAQVLTTTDSRLTAASLQQYPQLPINTDPTRIEEIRRTLYIGNLDSSQNPEQVLKFFNDIGEVKYIRVAGDETQPTRFAFVEFTHQSSVANALLHNGFVFGSRALKINHSNNPIVKPQPKLELEDPSKRLLDSRAGMRDLGSRSDRHHSSSKVDRNRDRSRGYYDRRMSPRNQRSRRSRSRDRDLYSRSRRSRSRDRSSRRSRSRDDLTRKRSRSRDSRKRRSRSRSSERRSKHKSSRRR